MRRPFPLKFLNRESGEFRLLNHNLPDLKKRVQLPGWPGN